MISTLRSRQIRRRSSSSGVGARTIEQTRGSPRLWASSARSKVSPSILSVLARRRRRGAPTDGAILRRQFAAPLRLPSSAAGQRDSGGAGHSGLPCARAIDRYTVIAILLFASGLTRSQQFSALNSPAFADVPSEQTGAEY